MEETEKNKRVKKILDYMYLAYGSDSGYLFGLPPERKGVIRTIIDLTLERNEVIERNPSEY